MYKVIFYRVMYEGIVILVLLLYNLSPTRTLSLHVQRKKQSYAWQRPCSPGGCYHPKGTTTYEPLERDGARRGGGGGGSRGCARGWRWRGVVAKAYAVWTNATRTAPATGQPGGSPRIRKHFIPHPVAATRSPSRFPESSHHPENGLGRIVNNRRYFCVRLGRDISPVAAVWKREVEKCLQVHNF